MLAIAAAVDAQVTVLRNVTLIDGNGGAPRQHASLVIEGTKVRAITDSSAKAPAGATVIDFSGKTVMPELINAHGHLGILKGTKMASENYTSENVQRQQLQYQDYGVGAVLVMGTDNDQGYQWRAESQEGMRAGAIIFTAGRGFGVPDGLPPAAQGMTAPYRPSTPDEARINVRELAQHKPDVVKMWVDDSGTISEDEAGDLWSNHRRSAQAAFACRGTCLSLGGRPAPGRFRIDILAHSVRDAALPDALVAEMKRKHVTYIGTLALDNFATAYADDPEWLTSAFFRNALEPGVYEMITSAKYKQSVKDDKKTPAELAAQPIARANLKKVFDAGIPVVLGTDSGAAPIRPFGFAEHRELQLLIEQGFLLFKRSRSRLRMVRSC